MADSPSSGNSTTRPPDRRADFTASSHLRETNTPAGAAGADPLGYTQMSQSLANPAPGSVAMPDPGSVKNANVVAGGQGSSSTGTALASLAANVRRPACSVNGLICLPKSNSNALLSYVETIFYMAELDRGLQPLAVAPVSVSEVLARVGAENTTSGGASSCAKILNRPSATGCSVTR